MSPRPPKFITANGMLGMMADCWNSVAEPIAARLVAGPVPMPRPVRKVKASKLALAIGVLADHPGWTNRQIADEAGATPEFLSRAKKFRAARAAIRDAGKAEQLQSKKSRSSDMDEYA